MLTNKEKFERLEMAIALMQDANASMQAALGDTEECFDLHCGIESMIEDLQEVLERLEEE
jgi:hypothetical protein